MSPFTLESADAFIFHSPYCKLVLKSLARLMLNDFIADPNPDVKGKYAALESFRYMVIVTLKVVHIARLLIYKGFFWPIIKTMINRAQIHEFY